MREYGRILGYLRPYSGLFLLALLAMTLFAALDAFSLTLLIPFLDLLFQQAGAGATGATLPVAETRVHQLLEWTLGGLLATESPLLALRNVVFVMFVVFLAKNLALYVQGYTVVVIEQRVTRDLRDQIFDHILRLGLPFFDRTRAGQIISRMTGDVDLMRSLVTQNLAKALSCAIQILFYVSLLLALSWKLTLVAFICLPAMLGMWQRLRRRLRRGVLRVLDALGELSSHIQERVSGIRLVKASGAEAWESGLFRALTRTHYKAVIRNERWRQLFPPATEMITASAILLLLWYGSRLVLLEGVLKPSDFLAFLALTMRLMSPVKWLGQLPALMQPGLAGSQRAFKLLDTEPEVFDLPDARPVSGFRDSIRFDGVEFAYRRGSPVLRDIELGIGRGGVVALVGPSGAGKSTLAGLLPRFYDPTAGRVTLDGVDLRELKLADLRGLIGLVSQETVVFHDTVRANIAYGLGDVSAAAVEAAARAAFAHDFVAALPEGYDTVVGERGTRFSGGQRQRLAIARALLRNPPILILDEATSSLDLESERLVQQAVEKLLEGRTVLVIAHRLSTIQRADRILVLEEGRIVQEGPHSELVAKRGLYRRLYDLQFSAAEPPPLEKV